jgi:hypothetical protein
LTGHYHPNGVICQGSVSFPVCASDTIELALSLFLEGSLFNGDLVANKCRSFPDDVRKLYGTTGRDEALSDRSSW